MPGFLQDLFLRLFFQIERAQHAAIAVGELVQALGDGLAELEQVGFRESPWLGGSGTTSGIGSSRIFRRRYSEITLRQMPFRNAPTASGFWIFSPRAASRKRARVS